MTEIHLSMHAVLRNFKISIRFHELHGGQVFKPQRLDLVDQMRLVT